MSMSRQYAGESHSPLQVIPYSYFREGPWGSEIAIKMGSGVRGPLRRTYKTSMALDEEFEP